YKYDQAGPCQMAVWIKALAASLQAGQVVQKRFLVLFGRPGIAPYEWYVAGITGAVPIAGPETKFSFIWNNPPTITFQEHPCMRIYMVQGNVTDAQIDAFTSPGPNNTKVMNSSQVSNFEGSFGVPAGGDQTAQMNFNNLSAGSCAHQQCRPLVGSTERIRVAGLNLAGIPLRALSPGPEPDDLMLAAAAPKEARPERLDARAKVAARIVARGYGVVTAPHAKQQFVFIEPVGGLGWVFPNDKAITVAYDYINPAIAETLVVKGKSQSVRSPSRKIFVAYSIEVAKGVAKPIVKDPTTPKLATKVFEPGQHERVKITFLPGKRPIRPPVATEKGEPRK
ncbi:MAG: hypothetical protein OEX21_13335, partial [Betaproteobacteria bacterium]|nr:hypothetical protein [Betaproteobacteria bacterium]